MPAWCAISFPRALYLDGTESWGKEGGSKTGSLFLITKFHHLYASRGLIVQTTGQLGTALLGAETGRLEERLRDSGPCS